MIYKSKYILGEYNVICDICRYKVKASQTRIDRRAYSPTKGLRVCLDDWDNINLSLGPAPRIPQDQRPVKDARPGTPSGQETFRSDRGGKIWDFVAENWNEVDQTWDNI
jgi:hypothetical protein